MDDSPKAVNEKVLDESQALTTKFTEQERYQIYKENFGKSYRELAKKAGVSYQTVCSDMRNWRKGGGFMDFVYERFGPLHESVEAMEPSTAYKALVRLIEKDMGDKVQLDATVEVGEKLNAVLSKVFGVKREEDESNDS